VRGFSSERKRDYYEVLGVPKSADQATMKKAYYQLAKKWHPDTNKDPDAQKRFSEISAAYDVLRDEKKRAQYDQYVSLTHLFQLLTIHTLSVGFVS